MLQNSVSQRYFLLIFLVVSLLFLPNSEYPNDDVFDSQRLLLKSLKDENPFLDFLVMFNQDIPSLESFNSLVISEFTNFPVIRIKFNSSGMKSLFLKNYQNEIHQIEPNQALEKSLLISQDELSRDSIAKVSIKDSTGAGFLHSIGLKGKGVKLGIIDTGVRNDSEIFGSRIKNRESFVTIANGYSHNIPDPDDHWGHGTNVASLAAGTTTGIAPEVDIYSAKIIHNASTRGAGGGEGEETTAGLLEAIDFLVNNSIDVINISLGQYHNLPSGLRDEVINYISIVHNVVFSVSVGNSGSSYGDRGTLNNPSTALQCIAATASNIEGNYIANFASRGPKVDYSLKPDIAAPGIDTPWDGTSFATPIVAGAAALLVDYLKGENISYSGATIKAALLAGAHTMREPIWEEGAGFINITRAWEILNSTEKIENNLDLVYLHPQKLPFEPYEVLFSGSSVVFNLTVISSRSLNTSVNIPEELSHFVSTAKKSYIINNTALIPINFTIPASTEVQSISGNISLCNKSLAVKFEIRCPIAKVLFDESLNRIVRHGYGTNIFESQGDTSSTIGMFSAFTRFLAYENNYSVNPHVRGTIQQSDLRNYDVLILANPLSLATDIYMDWVENPGIEYLSLTANTIEAVSQFVALGGGVLILSSDGSNYDITGLNELLKTFNLQIQTESSGIIHQTTIVTPRNFTKDISSFPFWGNYIQTIGSNAQVISETNGKATMALYETSTGGRVLLYGSDLMFDNIGFSDHAYNGNTQSNRILAFNSVAWLAKGEFIHNTSNFFPNLPVYLIILALFTSMTIIAILFIYKSKN